MRPPHSYYCSPSLQTFRALLHPSLMHRRIRIPFPFELSWNIPQTCTAINAISLISTAKQASNKRNDRQDILHPWRYICIQYLMPSTKTQKGSVYITRSVVRSSPERQDDHSIYPAQEAFVCWWRYAHCSQISWKTSSKHALYVLSIIPKIWDVLFNHQQPLLATVILMTSSSSLSVYQNHARHTWGDSFFEWGKGHTMNGLHDP